MKSSRIIVLSALLIVSSAQTISGPTDCLPAGGYTLCQNLWGASLYRIVVLPYKFFIDHFIESGVGSQTSTLTKGSASSVSWSTNYSWANGPNSVKSCKFCLIIG